MAARGTADQKGGTVSTRWFLGVDAGAAQHAMCLLDDTGTVISRYQLQHSSTACDEVVTDICRRTGGGPAEIAVAIEVPRGALVDFFLDRGCAVFAINPKQLDRFRDRYGAASPKDDARDAWVLADSLRVSELAFRRVHVDAAWVTELRELSRLNEALGEDLHRFTNRLREQLHRVTPTLLALCPGADAPWLWAVLAAAPTDAARRQLSAATLHALLKRHRVRRLTAARVLAATQAVPFPLAAGVAEAVERHIATLLPQIDAAYQARQACRIDLKRVLGQLEEQQEHRDVAILRSLPGVGMMTAATMLAEAWQPLCARDYHTLRAVAGVAPVTKQSGKLRAVRMRRACHQRLRDAAYHWARTSIVTDVGARRYYQMLRRRGISHGSAARRLADRWLRILIAMLNSQQIYDHSRHEQAA
jgi:transposase